MLIKLPYGVYIWHAICSSERQKGYRKAILKATLKEAEKIELRPILITCDESNIGSNCIILANRGLLENSYMMQMIISGLTGIGLSFNR